MDGATEGLKNGGLDVGFEGLLVLDFIGFGRSIDGKSDGWINGELDGGRDGASD